MTEEQIRTAVGRLVSLAHATEQEADILLAGTSTDANLRRDLSNFRYGQAIGLRQAAEMLAAELPMPKEALA